MGPSPGSAPTPPALFSPGVCPAPPPTPGALPFLVSEPRFVLRPPLGNPLGKPSPVQGLPETLLKSYLLREGLPDFPGRMRSSAGSRTGGALPVLFPLGPCTQDQRGCHQGRSCVGRWVRSSKRQTEASLPMLATGSSSSAGAGASAHRPSVPSGPDRRGPRGWHGASAGFWKQRVKSASSNLAPKGQPPAPEVARRPRIATAVQGWLALRGPGVFTEPLLSPRWVAALTAGGSGWGPPPGALPAHGERGLCSPSPSYITFWQSHSCPDKPPEWAGRRPWWGAGEEELADSA